MALPFTQSAAPETIPAQLDHTAGLYLHSKRKQWGYAILAWEKHNKRGYQFEDGTLRVFRRGYYRLFEEVDPPESKAQELIEVLNRRLERSLQRKARKSQTKSKKNVAPWSFEDQIKIFRSLYPGGFEDPQWVEKIRGVGARRRLKRHRQAAIDSIREAFEPAKLEALIVAQSFDEIWNIAVDQLQRTNLMTSSQMAPLKQLQRLQQRSFALALQGLLHGEGSHMKRFERFCSSMRLGRTTIRWQLATALQALYDPEKHVCVKPSAFRKQLPEVAPGIHIGKSPHGQTYKRLRKMAKLVKIRLHSEGLIARDMMDVHDFIWETLRPAAGKIIGKG